MVRIVSPEFDGMSESARRALVSTALKEELVTWRQYLTPEELKTAEEMPSVESMQLPLWPERLAQGSLQIEREDLITFLSDVDEEILSPLTVTFYSLRGGVGRSTALAHTARILAERGKKVVCLDMDLEAPGLGALFGVEHKVESGMGVVDLLISLDQGSSPDFSQHLIPVGDGEQIFLIPAGIPDAAYAHDLTILDPGAWYNEESNPLRMLFEGVRKSLPFVPDVILVDSRTGISSISAPLLFEQADLAVVVLFPHEQARRGTEALVRGLMGAPNYRSISYNGKMCGPEIRFLLSPLPSTRQLHEALYHRALEWVSEWLAPVQRSRQNSGLLELNEGELVHWISYGEALASSRNVYEVVDVEPLYGKVADWIFGLLPLEDSSELEASSEWDKLEILDEVRVDTGAAEDQERLLDVFIETEVVRKALDNKNPLVLGRKGTGKTALFRRIRESSGQGCSVLPVMSPSPSLDNLSSIRLGESLLRGLDESLISPQLMQWKQVWMAYILLLACDQGYLEAEFISSNLWGGALPKSPIELVRWLEGVSRQPLFGLMLEDAFKKMDESLSNNLLLLWDGLDTQFGNENADRSRRAAALVGLISLVLQWERSFKNILFKVLLREDIWRDLRFENKSHLYGRAVMLQWSDQNSFLQVLIKQLWRSEKFAGWIKRVLPNSERLDAQIERWSDEDVASVWHLIAGVRMSGGRTTFTRNWIWTRLSDANNDHAPRHLLQLLRAAVEREKEQETKTSYFRSLIRPNTLIKVLPEVSIKALDALVQEEFHELVPLTDRLREIARTPFDSAELDDIDKDLLFLAREVGLIGVHEGTDQRVERYRVPELYRLALNMTRKGQA